MYLTMVMSDFTYLIDVIGVIGVVMVKKVFQYKKKGLHILPPYLAHSALPLQLGVIDRLQRPLADNSLFYGRPQIIRN